MNVTLINQKRVKSNKMSAVFEYCETMENYTKHKFMWSHCDHHNIHRNKKNFIIIIMIREVFKKYIKKYIVNSMAW